MDFRGKIDAEFRRVGWNSVAAVRNGHIYEIKSAYILQPGPAALTERLRQLHGHPVSGAR